MVDKGTIDRVMGEIQQGYERQLVKVRVARKGVVKKCQGATNDR
jgi:hypothetical protein